MTVATVELPTESSLTTSPLAASRIVAVCSVSLSGIMGTTRVPLTSNVRSTRSSSSAGSVIFQSCFPVAMSHIDSVVLWTTAACVAEGASSACAGSSISNQRRRFPSCHTEIRPVVSTTTKSPAALYPRLRTSLAAQFGSVPHCVVRSGGPIVCRSSVASRLAAASRYRKAGVSRPLVYPATA